MTGTNTGRGIYQKGRLIDSGGAVSFPSIPDMWKEMQRRNHDTYYNYINLFNIYERIKYFMFIYDIEKTGV